ncbi:MAG: hypothetical protein Q8M65_10655, partial [Rhodoglobus sp.]|nr:hypothetical protein [Rhodoglobus sp.]
EQRAAEHYAAEQQAQRAAWEAQQQSAQQQAAQQAAAVQPERLPEPSIWTPPPGHWSAQPGIEEQDPFENTYSRTFGSAPATTSALVISSVPADIRGPLTGTGETILTGTVDLPRSFSSTGASARFDSEGIDAFFDADDAEVISTDSAPVRAIKAVSTHNSGQGVMHTQKPKGTRALTVLLIAASVMAVAVAGLLVAAFAFNIF